MTRLHRTRASRPAPHPARQAAQYPKNGPLPVTAYERPEEFMMDPHPSGPDSGVTGLFPDALPG
ncbi:hypothetical protein ACFQX6_47355 [Streptosporangium lutulentum]